MKHTEQAKQKISQATQGRVAWNKGLTKADPRVAKYCKGQSARMKGRIPWNKGKRGVQKWSEHQRKIMEARKGENHPQFSGTNVAYWKRTVKLRDNFTCQICELRDEEIMQVDHIKPVSTHPELSCDIENMRVLCPNCHARKSIREKRTKRVTLIASVKTKNGLA